MYCTWSAFVCGFLPCIQQLWNALPIYSQLVFRISQSQTIAERFCGESGRAMRTTMAAAAESKRYTAIYIHNQKVFTLNEYFMQFSLCTSHPHLRSISLPLALSFPHSTLFRCIFPLFPSLAFHWTKAGVQ